MNDSLLPRKIIAFLLSALLVLSSAVCAFAEIADINEMMSLEESGGVSCQELSLPDSPEEFSPLLAKQALYLCSGHFKDRENSRLSDEGFEVMLQKNYKSAADTPSHSCAYTLAKKMVKHKDTFKLLYVVVIRATDGGEWYSNMDFAPSHSNDTAFAENFLLAAESIFLDLDKIFETANPFVLVCGHSRGAACANILGMLLNARYGSGKIYTYTYASPLTVKGDKSMFDETGIFNIINSSDLITRLPLAEWGFSRFGTDISFCGDEALKAKLDTLMDTTASISPTIEQYYLDRHSLGSPGLSESGISSFELFMLLSSSLVGEDNSKKTNYKIDISTIGYGSDYMPLFDALRACSEDDEELAEILLSQHMPYKYQAGLEQLFD